MSTPTPTPTPTIDAVTRALLLMTLTPHIRRYLMATDPQALKQACEALRAAGVDPDPSPNLCEDETTSCPMCGSKAVDLQAASDGVAYFMLCHMCGYRLPEHEQDSEQDPEQDSEQGVRS